MDFNYKKIWNIRADSTVSAESAEISDSLGISNILATLLLNRGYKTVRDVKAFLGKSTEILHDPFLMNDMEKGAKRILEAVENKEKISVYGSFKSKEGYVAIAYIAPVLGFITIPVALF